MSIRHIPRIITDELVEELEKGNKAILLYGPRRVGKTSLVHAVVRLTQYKTLWVNGDQQEYVDILSSRDLKKIKGLVSGYELLVIDEAQRIPQVGINMKIIIDEIPDIKIIATGSSSFDLAQKVSESLTGRAWSYTLYPIAFLELSREHNDFELRYQLEQRLIYGSYPEIFLYENNEEKKRYLDMLTTTYLYKDILEMGGIKHAKKLRDLLKLIAFQIGNEVSISELATSLGMGKNTIEHYIDLLEKSFVIFRIGGLSRNLRKEVNKMDKIYFYDLGVRNAIIDNMKDLKSRDDVGQLWENFLINERTKRMKYGHVMSTSYFWRTYTGAEIDYVEERDGMLRGYEFKYGTRKSREPKAWKDAYDNSTFKTINSENFLEFICN